eukprot:PhF_6_TR22245/c0_g1_i2/m.31419
MSWSLTFHFIAAFALLTANWLYLPLEDSSTTLTVTYHPSSATAVLSTNRQCPTQRFPIPQFPIVTTTKDSNIIDATTTATQPHFGRVHFVVAQHKEDLSWLPPSIYTQSVYRTENFNERFETVEIQHQRTIHTIANFCNECHPYLRYVIDHYDHLPEITVFMHAFPGKHNPKMFHWVSCLKHSINFRYLTGTLRGECDLNNATAAIAKWRHPRSRNRKAFLHAWQTFPWRRLLNLTAIPPCVTFYAGAHFAVSKKSLQRRPKEFYENVLVHVQRYMMDEYVVKKYEGYGNDAMGHVLERIWHVLFGGGGEGAEVLLQMKPYNTLPCSTYFRTSCCESEEGVG